MQQMPSLHVYDKYSVTVSCLLVDEVDETQIQSNYMYIQQMFIQHVRHCSFHTVVFPAAVVWKD